MEIIDKLIMTVFVLDALSFILAVVFIGVNDLLMKIFGISMVITTSLIAIFGIVKIWI